MDPLEEFYQLKETIRSLEDRAQTLRSAFLRPGARLRSNRFEVVVKHQKRRVFQKDRLLPAILNDPRFWVDSINPVVSVRALDGADAPDDDLQLIERFDTLSPPARPFATPLSWPSRG